MKKDLIELFKQCRLEIIENNCTIVFITKEPIYHANKVIKPSNRDEFNKIEFRSNLDFSDTFGDGTNLKLLDMGIILKKLLIYISYDEIKIIRIDY